MEVNQILYEYKKPISGSMGVNSTSLRNSGGTVEAVGTPYGVKNKILALET